MNTHEHKIEDPAEMAVTASGEIAHPGAFIRETLLPEYGLKVAPAAKAMDIDRAGFIRVLDGKSAVSRDLAYKLGALMRDEVADLLIAWQLKYDLQHEAEIRAAYRTKIKRVEPVDA